MRFFSISRKTSNYDSNYCTLEMRQSRRVMIAGRFVSCPWALHFLLSRSLSILRMKKPKASEGGKSVDAVPPQKKKAKRKPAVSDGGNGGTRGATGLDNAVTTNTSTTTAAHPSASALSIVGKLSPVADNVGSVSCVATGTAGNAANTGANVSVVAREGGSGDGLGVHVGMAAAGASAAGVQGQVTETNSGSSASSAPSAATTAAAIHHYKANGGTPGIPMAMMVAGGVVTMERDAAGGVVVGMGSGDAATFGSDGGSGATVAAGSSAGKGGGDVKTAATNSILMGQSLDPALKIALARFEEGERPRRSVSSFTGTIFLCIIFLREGKRKTNRLPAENFIDDSSVLE